MGVNGGGKLGTVQLEACEQDSEQAD